MRTIHYSALFALLVSVSACGFLPDSWSDWTDNTPVIEEAKPTDDTAVKADADKAEITETKVEETTSTVEDAGHKTEVKTEKVAATTTKNASRFTSSSDDDSSPNLAEMPEPPQKSELPSKKEISQTRKSLQKQLGDDAVDTADKTAGSPPVPKLDSNASGETTVLPLGSEKSESKPVKNSKVAAKSTASTKYTSSDDSTADDMPRSGKYTAADDATTDTNGTSAEAIEAEAAKADFADAETNKTSADDTNTSTTESAPAKDQELLGDLLGLTKSSSGEGLQLKNLGKAPKYKGGSAATIYFAQEGVAINQAQFNNLKKVAATAKRDHLKVKVVGTPVSSDMPTLGTQRLINIAAYLVDFGVPAEKVQLQLITKFADSNAETSPRAEVILSK